eukprot:CAMPEP_0196771802 /NCGR_PEP_ID=MMETSP1104-20130614/1889_1 /TAXON_ID=33652 /ORGANISM="Cafeteria sp., Strain Caron Lab Isolate" /LENGTH=403 /DNA_ID=CAMNT_0042141927 /DNA_START=6 /DNA_END=1217 /DNA_ORIENTATION=+
MSRPSRFRHSIESKYQPPLRTYILDLDRPPESRWDEVATEHRARLAAALVVIARIIRTDVGRFAWLFAWWVLVPLMSALTWLGVVPFAGEIRGIARKSGIPAGALAGMQYVYEVAAACTSIVVEDSSTRRPVHLRTLDWLMGPLPLYDLTVQLRVVRGGRTVCMATTFVGYVGFYTGMQPGRFAVSINFRTDGRGHAANLGSALRGGWLLGSFVRRLLERPHTFADAKAACGRVRLIAPCYFILSGVRAGEGVVLTRGRTSMGGKPERPLAASDGRLVQVNTDADDLDPLHDVLESAARRSKAIALLDRASTTLATGAEVGAGAGAGSDREDTDTVDAVEVGEEPAVRGDADVGYVWDTRWSVVSVKPIFNGETQYATVMSAGLGYYDTRPRNPIQPLMDIEA